MVSNDRFHRTRVNTGDLRTRCPSCLGASLRRALPKPASPGNTNMRTSAKHWRKHRMATGLTKTALIRLMAEKLELTNKQVGTFFDTLAETAVKETKKNGVFIIPGIGRLVKGERKASVGR